jgi:hypothetical protein
MARNAAACKKEEFKGTAHEQETIDFIKECIQRYGSGDGLNCHACLCALLLPDAILARSRVGLFLSMEGVAFSFNGGKDCTVALALRAQLLLHGRRFSINLHSCVRLGASTPSPLCRRPTRADVVVHANDLLSGRTSHQPALFLLQSIRFVLRQMKNSQLCLSLCKAVLISTHASFTNSVLIASTLLTQLLSVLLHRWICRYGFSIRQLPGSFRQGSVQRFEWRSCVLRLHVRPTYV